MDVNEVLDQMKFVKVVVQNREQQSAGHLTDISSIMLLLELRRNGFDIVRRAAHT